MLHQFPRPRCLLPVVLVLALAGCSDGPTPGPAGGAANTPNAATASAPASPSAPVVTPLPTPSPTSPSSPALKRTRAELTKALLSLKDLPAGFEVDKGGGDDGTRMSSRTKACSPLVRLMNDASLPGSREQADVSFSGGQDGPYIDETLDAMGSNRAARAFVETYRTSVRACRSIRVTVPGIGSSDVDVREISFARIGDDTFAARFRARSGALEGLELIQAGVQSGDVVVGVTTVGFDGSDAEAATDDAVSKAGRKLGTSGAI